MNVDRDNIDPLDELLAAARWPEMSAEATGRLRAGYVALAGRRGWGVVVWWGSVAAAVIVGVGVWMWVAGSGGERKAVVVKTEHPSAVAEAKVTVRPANAAEMMVALTAAARQQRMAVAREEVAESPTPAVDVAAELKAIAGKTRAGEALRALKEAQGRERVVDELFARLDDPREEIRLAAARALGYLDGPAVTGRLAGMVEEGRNRREALAALMQSDGKEAREYLRQAAREEHVGAAMRSVEVQVRSF